MVHTLHVMPSADQASSWWLAGSPWISAISRSRWGAFPELRAAASLL